VLVQVAYAIGVSEPVSIDIDTKGTGVLSDADLRDLVREHFALSPTAIIDRFDLKKPGYRKTAAYGHFGRSEFAWEKLDYVDTLKRAAAEVTA
jgi:S-adenosylmethionine synthetase